MPGSASSSLLHALSLLAVPLLQWLLLPPGSPLLPSPAHGASWRAFLLLGVIPFLWFGVCAGAWALADALVVSGASPALAACKLQPLFRPSPRDYLIALSVALQSWVLVGLPFAWLLVSALGPRLGVPASAVDAPWSPWEFARHLPAFLIAVELGFYTSHRALHSSRAAYALVHRQHHEFSAPFALAAVYAHPLEHLLSNVLPISAGPLLMRSHPFTGCLWACLAIFSTCGAHSGYNIPGLTRAPFHDWHHEAYTENFGVLGAFLGLDALLGTSARFRARLREKAA